MAPDSPSRSHSSVAAPMRVLVVDDEPMIARGIKSMLERIDDPRVGEVTTAFSGADAVERVRDTEPDVVILDIRMPGMSGLEVLERCGDGARSTAFFVLSGHDEFDYVKRAFKLGALDYLLKPASLDDLSALIDTASQRIPAAQLQSIAVDVTARWSVQVEVERALDERSGTPISDAVAGTSTIGDWYRFAIIRTSRAIPDDALSLRKRIGPQLWEQSAGDHARVYFFWTPDSDLGLLWNLRDRDAIEPVDRCWADLSPGVRNASGSFFAVGDAVGPEARVADAYDTVAAILLYRFTIGDRSHASAAEVRERYGVPSAISVEEAVREAAAGRLERVIEASDRVFADAAYGHGSALQTAYDTLVESIAHFCERAGLSVPRLRRMAELDTLRHVRDEIANAVASVRSATAAPPESTHPVDYAIDYVDGHLGEELSMAQVAEAAGMSYSHFSRVFKERTGEGFNRYLLRKRMERARAMLSRPTVRVSEVAYAVGYRSHKHFTRAFRDYYGRTPSEVRGVPK
ncbi:MAG: response regulator [Spirochaetaceae bacterium]|nr:MAG: response regulator [Spirochaetaceae bacterium]